jgi:hypothetical protein
MGILISGWCQDVKHARLQSIPAHRMPHGVDSEP